MLALGQAPPRLNDAVTGLPVEYRADLILRAFNTGQFTDKRLVLEELFAAAVEAQYPTALLDAGEHSDTRSWAIATGMRFQLDGLSIRCRVVREMLGLDPDRARELFLSIVLPPAETARCEDALLPDTRIFFETAQAVADRSFPPAGRERGDAIQFLEPVLRAVASPLQVSAAARLVRIAQASPEQRQKLLGIFAARLADIHSGYRSFAYAAKELGLEDELIRLGEECQNQHIGFDMVLAAYRTFLVNHLGTERCGDSANPAPMVKRFNERLRLAGYLARADLDLIPGVALRPTSTDGRLKLEAYWRTAQSKRLLSAIKHLRFGGGAMPLSPVQKATPEWQAEFRRFLNDLEDWTAGDESSPLDYFHERAILYASVLELLPPGDARANAARSYVSFLSGSGVESESPIQFLPHVRALISFLLQAEDRENLLAALAETKDPVISIYLSQERLTSH